ncbi:MAG: hypothetical protein K2W95_33120 [Candidatus Obscuribacterales bacterium]|nr:hypothetical protein [Candidatus Obscuribacterales bacterium]
METEHAKLSKFWPTPQDYNEALQNLATCFADPELNEGAVELNALGLPRPNSGAFASVYKVTSGNKSYAVRCFLLNIRDMEERYRHISQFVMNDNLPHTVAFEFQKRGVLVRGQWFPILKMDWVEGRTLERYIEDNLEDSRKLSAVLRKFEEMCAALESEGVAHGDLQHGNILVPSDSELRLVDYDGMYVPSMAGLESNELGHRNYQHPRRSREHFGPFLDNFAKWSIYLSLLALTEAPSFYRLCQAGADCLLLRKEDYELPAESQTIRILMQNGSPLLVRRLQQLLWLASNEPSKAVTFTEADKLNLPPIVSNNPQTSLAMLTAEQKVRQSIEPFKAVTLAEADQVIPPSNDSSNPPNSLTTLTAEETLLFKYFLRTPYRRSAPITATNFFRPDSSSTKLIMQLWLVLSMFLLVAQPGWGLVNLIPFLWLWDASKAPETYGGHSSGDSRAKRLVELGVATYGTITDFRQPYVSVSGERLRLVSYRYSVKHPNGKTEQLNAKFDAPEALWDDAKLGETLVVLYYATAPEESIPFKYAPYGARKR